MAKHQVATAGPLATVPSGDAIGTFAKAQSDASYTDFCPCLTEVDWLNDIYFIYLKPLPGKTAPKTLKAVEKMFV